MTKTMCVLLLGMLISFGAYAKVKPGSTPPNNLGKTLQGKQIMVSALRGEVVVISFWATWCHYCMEELPILAGLQSVAAKKGLKMQVVAVDYRQTLHTFAEASRLLNSRLPNLLVTRDFNGKIGKPYGADKGIPVMVMLHRDGTVAYVHVGYSKSELDTLIAEINDLLNEPAKPANGITSNP
ncbi:MAG: TlpA family protein disulfide reductase [Gammaproteobacteria bacterium]